MHTGFLHEILQISDMAVLLSLVNLSSLSSVPPN